MRQISDILGFSDRTLRRLRRESDSLSAAISRGKTTAMVSIAHALYGKALSGDVNAAKFWLSRRGGPAWAEKRKETVRLSNCDNTSNRLLTLANKVESMTDDELKYEIQRYRALSEEI